MNDLGQPPRLLAGALPDEVARRLSATVRIVVPGERPAWRHQLAAIALVELIGRFCSAVQLRLDADAPAHELLPPGPGLLIDHLADALANGGGHPAPGDATPALTVVIGEADQGDVHVDGSGWVAYLGTQASPGLPDDATNPIGPLVAACRGASQVHQRLLGDLLAVRTEVDTSWWSALTLTELHAPPEGVGPALASPSLAALLMGAGSIGGAAAYAFARTPQLGGALTILDPQVVEARNQRKAILARAADIDERKTDCAMRELRSLDGLAVAAEPQTLAEWVAAGPPERPLPTVLCAVDSVIARRELQDHGPLHVVNAACGDVDITVSGHVTERGPCVYCLHIEQVMDIEATRKRILARETGMPEAMVSALLVERTPLGLLHLRGIENHRGEPAGALAAWQGRTLEDLYRERILYGEARVRAEGAEATVVAPFVTALAGFLLASEAIKAAQPGLEEYALGPEGPATKYEESLSHRPAGMLTRPARWTTTECLCRSTRRLALMRARYGVLEA